MVKELTQEVLKEILTYDPITGNFYRNLSGGGIEAGGLAGGSTNSGGYEHIRVDGKKYKSHRLAFLYMVGRWPEEIDHINGVRNDNSWENLRECNRKENNRNSKTPITNTSGIKGVSPASRGSKWVAQLNINGKNTHLGTFNTIPEAEQAVKAARVKHHDQFHLHG